MELDRDFNEFVASFIAHDVRFLIVGGYALAVHGVPRATGDLDTWVVMSDENSERIMDALRDFGFGAVGIEAEDFKRSESVVQLGFPPFRIDILTTIDGVQFEQAWARRVEVEIGGLLIPFIGRDDLIANKIAVGRPQDVADVRRLTE